MNLFNQRSLLCVFMIISCISFFSCQKSYENNTEVLSLLKDIKYNDSLLLSSYKGLQKQVDSLLKIANLNTIQLNLLKTTIDSVQSKLVSIQIQLNSSTANTIDIQKQLTQLLTLYQSLLLQISNIQYSCGLSDSLKNGMLAFYPFTGNANDSSGNGNHGIVSGAILTSDRFGNLNSAYTFGANKVINVPNPKVDLNLTGDFSISSWFYFDTLTTLYNGSALLSKHDGDIGNDGWIYGIWNPDHNITTQILNFQTNNQFNTNTYPGSSGIVKDKKWYHFIVTYNYTSQLLNYYLNGNSVFSKNIQFQVIANSLDLTIGYSKSSRGTYLNSFLGKIDDIRIYKRVLSNAEVQYLSTH